MDVSKYAALFLAESREHLGTCNQLLLEWERTPAATAPVGGIFRAVHTIKGMAATMGHAAVADLAHRAENLLDALRAGRVAPAPAVFQLLFRAIDALSGGVDAAATGTDAVPDEGLLHQLDRAARRPAVPDAVPPSGRGAASTRRRKKARRGSDVSRIRPIQVVIRSDVPLRGARAVLVLRKAEELGAVTAVRPAPGALEQEGFDGRLTFRLQTAAGDDEIAAALTAAGDVQAVRFDESDVAAPAAARQIRVDLRRLDALMRQVGELVVARNRLTALAAASADAELMETSAQIARLASDVQGEVIAARMTPVGEVFERFPRLVRDLARDLDKQIRLDMEGEEIELDRSILDEIGEPLLHLVRNAADHGIEYPAARSELGKPAEGRILLSATRERDAVAIRVTDDGRGIDRDAILAKAKREGLADPAADALGDDVLIRVLARPGFSTAQAVSGVSGRGVGVDVAMTRVRALGGTLGVRSELGRGTTFTIRVPLTLAIVRALLADACGERYAVPLAYVAETVDFDSRAVTAIRGREALVVRDEVIPTVHLRDLVGAADGPVPPRRPTVVLEIGERRTALVVDALVGQQEIVVEPFDAPRGMPPFIGGATILADGAPALILDAAAIL